MNEFNEKEKEKILESLIGSIDSDEHNDVKIILEDGVIKANKLILSRRSEYFQKMFDKKSQFVEQKQNSVKFSCKKRIMRKILAYIYGGDLLAPHARTLNMVKKIPRQFGPWNPLETPICLNMPLVLKEFLGPFLRKCILKNSNFYSENI